MHTFLLLFLATAAAQAQNPVVSFGVKGGVPLTEAVSQGARTTVLQSGTSLVPIGGPVLSTVTTGRWTVGPTVELHLPWSFSIEFDALYRTYRSGTLNTFRYLPEFPIAIQTFNQVATAWDFPLLLKYRLPGQKVRPFVLAGKSWTRTSTTVGTSSVCSSSESCLPSDFPSGALNYSLNSISVRDGIVAGGGVEIKYRRLSLSPELRYTRLLQPKSNQVTLLFGLTF